MTPITCTVRQAMALSGLGETKLYELLGTGELRSIQVGRRRLVNYQSLMELLRACPQTDIQQKRGLRRRGAASSETKSVDFKG